MSAIFDGDTSAHTSFDPAPSFRHRNKHWSQKWPSTDNLPTIYATNCAPSFSLHRISRTCLTCQNTRRPMAMAMSKQCPCRTGRTVKHVQHCKCCQTSVRIKHRTEESPLPWLLQQVGHTWNDGAFFFLELPFWFFGLRAAGTAHSECGSPLCMCESYREQ